MSGPQPSVPIPSVPGVLRGHQERLRQTEAPQPGQWVYALPIAPATPPTDLVPSDPLAPTFKNGCTNIAGSQAVSFRIHPSTRLALRGAVDLHGHSLPVVVFTLPDGFRPAYPSPVVFPSSDGTLVYTGRVDPNGDVWLLGSK